MAELKQENISIQHLDELYSEMGLLESLTAIITGGAVFRALIQNEEPSDVDIMFSNKWDYLTVLSTLTSKGWHKIDQPQTPYYSGQSGEHHRVLMGKNDFPKLDLIYVSEYQDMTWGQVLAEFDLNLSQFAYTPGKLYWLNDARGDRRQDLAQKRLLVIQEKKTTQERFQKYLKLLSGQTQDFKVG